MKEKNIDKTKKDKGRLSFKEILLMLYYAGKNEPRPLIEMLVVTIVLVGLYFALLSFGAQEGVVQILVLLIMACTVFVFFVRGYLLLKPND